MTTLPSKSLSSLKTLAKKLSKEKGVTHTEALDLIAKQEGFSSWSLLAKQFSDYIINSFDLLCEEIFNGCITLLASGPNVGKTTLAINILLKALKSNQKVCYLSSHISKSEIKKRLHAIHTSLPQAEFDNYPHELSVETIKGIARSIELLDNKNFVIETLSTFSTSTIMSHIEKQDEGNTLFIIDYVQAVELDTADAKTHEELVFKLKSVNRRLNSILLLNQINDEDVYHNGNKVFIKDIVGGDNLIRHCDFVLGMNRHSSSRNDSELCILKSVLNSVPALRAQFHSDVGLFAW